jgi:uncharacterized protein (TIGR02391 family)
MLLTDLPDVNVLLALPREELAEIVLRTASKVRQNNICHLQDLPHQVFGRPGYESRFPERRRREVEIALGEAWVWLTTNGLLVPDAGINGANGFMRLTPRAEKLVTSSDDFRKFRQSISFPKELLHPAIADKVWLALARGELDDAVFAAFKAVEVAVREAAKLAPTDIGAALMRKAFDKTSGPLTDQTQPEAEREALAHLFAGAIGSYKNPHSHRTVSITDPLDAQEMVMLASHLLRIVDVRKK